MNGDIISNPWPGAPSAGGGSEMRDPVAYIRAMHGRIAAICNRLAIVSDDLWHRGREDNAAAILAFLEEDLPKHFEDEELSLLPRLRQRAPRVVSDDLETRLRDDHEIARQLIRRILPGLTAISIGFLPENPAFFAVELIRLEQHLHGYMGWEEQVVFPLMREYLSVADGMALIREIATMPREAPSLPGRRPK